MANDCAECRERRRKYAYHDQLRSGVLRRVSLVVPRERADDFITEAKRVRDEFINGLVVAHHG